MQDMERMNEEQKQVAQQELDKIRNHKERAQPGRTVSTLKKY